MSISDPAPGVRVGPASVDNAPLVRELMLIAFESLRGLDPPSSAFDETEADVAAAIARGGAAIAYLGERPVGSVRFEPEGNCLYISRLAVIPDARRMGIASALMHAAEAGAARFDRARAEVGLRSHLTGNHALFTALGYELLWEHPHPRNPTVTHLRMRKELPDARVAASPPANRS